jgi:hypothetical protein
MAKASKHTKQEVNPVALENPAVVNEDLLEEGLTAEEKAFKKSQKDGYDPNRLENPHARLPSLEQAKATVKSYGDFTNKEVPNDLLAARYVIKNSK